MKYYVYQLIDPKTNKIFYIGKGQKLRMYQHVKDVQRGRIPNRTNVYLYYKIKEILDSGYKIKYKEVFETDIGQEAYNREKQLITEIGLKNLCNITEGGKGGSGMFEKKHSEETKCKMSKAHDNVSGRKNPFYGKTHTNEIKKHLSNEKLKYFSVQKNRDKMSELLKEKYSNLTKQEREKRFGNNKGKKQWNYGLKGYKLHSKSKRISEKYLDTIINLRTQGLSYEKIAIIISEKENEKIGWWIIRTIRK